MLGQYGDIWPDTHQQRLGVTLDIDGIQYELGAMLYQAPQDAITREISNYRYLAGLAPVVMPGFIAGDAGWLVIEDLEDLCAPDAWTVDDYREAVDQLALLHDRFMGLEVDLDNFFWLHQPLARDYHATCQQVYENLPQLDTPPPDDLALLHALGHHLDAIAAPLREATQTLLHRAYWPGHIARPEDGRQIVTHWREAGIGPPILDVLIFYQQTASHLTPSLPLEAALARYRVQLSQQQKRDLWPADAWAREWDHALLWQLATVWLPRLAGMSSAQYDEVHDRLARVWYAPARAALNRLDT